MAMSMPRRLPTDELEDLDAAVEQMRFDRFLEGIPDNRRRPSCCPCRESRTRRCRAARRRYVA